ncbi:MAG: CotH kinase family protein [Clostridia bacterium]|nr:CotH kinase family protein [Clostridia bacterium]
MNKLSKIIALILVSVMLISSLTSCDILSALITGQDSSDNTNDPGKDEGNKEDDKDSQGQTPEKPDDGEKPIDPETPDPEKPTEPEKPQGYREPEEVIDPEDEANRERYGYLPVISSTMPAVHINTPDGSNSWATSYGRGDKLADRIEYVDATVTVDECEEEFAITDAEAEVKVRGNYTLEYPKKPIRIKFKSKTNMLGLNDGEKYKNWVLLADYKDLSLSNNSVAFYLGNTILASDGYYSTDFRNVEVYLNGQYWGVYLLVEQQEVKGGRTSVPEVEDGYTGNDIGYFFEYDSYYVDENNMPNGAGDPTFVMNYSGMSARNPGYTVKSDINADSQLTFLKNYMDNAFYIAYQACQYDKFYKFNEDFTAVVPAPEYTTAAEAVSAVIDVQSLVDTYILNEIACDLDVDWSSFYLSLNMTAEGNKKITFEAPWDFDSSFGMRDGICNDGQGMYALNSNNPWFKLIKDEAWFFDLVCKKWSELKKYDVLDNTIKLVMDEKSIYLDYYKKNNQRWPERVIGGNGEVCPELNSYKDIRTAQGLAADYLIRWLNARFTYLDSQWIIEGEKPFAEKQDQIVNRPSNATAYRFEAEDAELSGFTTESPIRTNRSYASGKSYVGDVYEGSSISFTFNLEKSTTIYIYASVSSIEEALNFNSSFTVTLNGNKISIPASREIPAVEEGDDAWHSFVCIRLTTVLVPKGENTITFTAEMDTTNFDFIEIYSSEKIS